MKLRNPFLVKTVGLVGATVVQQLLSTLDLRIDFGPSGFHPANPRESRFIYVVWHENLLLPTVMRTKAYVLISQHGDGELITQCVRHFRYGVVRGSSTRGGTAALFHLLEVSKHAHLFITPDGPRGPRRVVQPGAVFVAAQTGLPIVPIGVGFSNAWRAKSWDRFAVPKPFSGARGVVGEPIVVPKGANGRELIDYVHLVQDRMLSATAEAEAWAAGQPRKTPSSLSLPLARSA